MSASSWCGKEPQKTCPMSGTCEARRALVPNAGLTLARPFGAISAGVLALPHSAETSSTRPDAPRPRTFLYAMTDLSAGSLIAPDLAGGRHK
jgi:hypothetical protein